MKTYSTGTFSGIKTAGFTLIELVVVIVILGILAASAAPKLMNMQGDARAATLIAIKGAVRSANNMVYSKSLITNANTEYSDKITGSIQWPLAQDCRTGSCVNMGNMWLYTKFGYIDRNSVSYVVDTDIGGNEKTKQVTNPKTNEKIIVPDRGPDTGNVVGYLNYKCPSTSVICTGHDYCQCRKSDFMINGKNRDTQIIVPKGFDYNIDKHKNGGCYFGYTTSDKLKGDPKPQPPAYTLRIGGC